MHLEIKEICNKFSLSGTRDFSKIRVSSSRKQKTNLLQKTNLSICVVFALPFYTKYFSGILWGKEKNISSSSHLKDLLLSHVCLKLRLLVVEEV